MKNIFYFILLFLSLTSCALSNSTLNIDSSIEDNSSISESSKKEIELSTEFIKVFVGEQFRIRAISNDSITWVISNDIVRIEYDRYSQFNVIGLKEGKTTIKATSISGESKECEVIVLNKDSVTSLEDFYNLAPSDKEKKYSAMFFEFYLVEYYNEILKSPIFIYNSNLYNDNLEPFYSIVLLKYINVSRNEFKVMTNEGEKNITNFELGSKFIFHLDSTSFLYYVDPVTVEYYNIYYANDKLTGEIEYYSHPLSDSKIKVNL